MTQRTTNGLDYGFIEANPHKITPITTNRESLRTHKFKCDKCSKVIIKNLSESMMTIPFCCDQDMDICV